MGWKLNIMALAQGSIQFDYFESGTVTQDNFSYNVIPTGNSVNIPINQQMTVHGSLNIEGTGQLTISGQLSMED